MRTSKCDIDYSVWRESSPNDLAAWERRGRDGGERVGSLEQPPQHSSSSGGDSAGDEREHQNREYRAPHSIAIHSVVVVFTTYLSYQK